MDTLKKWADSIFVWVIMYPTMIMMTEVNMRGLMNPPDPFDFRGNWVYWVKFSFFIVLLIILHSIIKG